MKEGSVNKRITINTKRGERGKLINREAKAGVEKEKGRKNSLEKETEETV